MKFELRKNITTPKDHNQVNFRIKDEKLLAAFKKAQVDSNKSVASLVQEMMEHCLKDAGYLK